MTRAGSGGALIAGALIAGALVTIACGGKRAPAPMAGGHDAGDAGLALDAGPPPPTDAARAAGTAPDYRVVDVSHAGAAKVTVTWPERSGVPAALSQTPRNFA